MYIIILNKTFLINIITNSTFLKIIFGYKQFKKIVPTIPYIIDLVMIVYY